MFTVHGYVNGYVVYAVTVDPDAESGAGIEDGVITDAVPDAVLGVLFGHTGEQVRHYATGETVTLTLDNPDAVVAALREFTDVVRITGDYQPPADDDDADLAVDGVLPNW